jgi:hypothetical protein
LGRDCAFHFDLLQKQQNWMHDSGFRGWQLPNPCNRDL